MKKKIFIVAILLLISFSAIFLGSNMENKSLKKIPDSAVLL